MENFVVKFKAYSTIEQANILFQFIFYVRVICNCNVTENNFIYCIFKSTVEKPSSFFKTKKKVDKSMLFGNFAQCNFNLLYC